MLGVVVLIGLTCCLDFVRPVSFICFCFWLLADVYIRIDLWCPRGRYEKFLTYSAIQSFMYVLMHFCFHFWKLVEYCWNKRADELLFSLLIFLKESVRENLHAVKVASIEFTWFIPLFNYLTVFSTVFVGADAVRGIHQAGWTGSAARCATELTGTADPPEEACVVSRAALGAAVPRSVSFIYDMVFWFRSKQMTNRRFHWSRWELMLWLDSNCKTYK